jgi:hypothetical protein
MNTMKSIGVTHYELASAKNFTDSNKRVIIRVRKNDAHAYLACSEQLSAELRACNSSQISEKMKEISELIIGEELEVLS